MKILKYNSKIKIALFFLMFFLIIVFFNNESNATAYSSVSSVLSSGYAKDGLKVGDTVTGGSMSAVFGNNAVYCIETGNQYVESNYTYTLKQIIEVNSTTNSKYQPLLYIFKNYPKSAFTSSSSTMTYFNNASQIAIWGTIKKKSNFNNSYFDAKDNINVNSGISGYDAISTYLYTTRGYSSYNVARPYFAVYYKDSSNHKFYYGVASYQTKYPSTLNVVGTDNSYKRASHLAYLIYQKATETTAQKYEGKIYVFHSNNSQNFIIFSKPDEIKTTPTINLNLYKKDTSNTKVKGAKVEISSNSNVKTINGVKSAITVESNDTSGKFNNSAIEIVPSTNNGTVKINLIEKSAPSGYLKMENAVVLTINYNTTTGAITGISANKNTNYINYKSSTQINLVNAKLPEWYIYKKDQNNNSVKDISFDTTIKITGGGTYTGTYTSGTNGKTGNIICADAQKEMAKKYMSTNKNVIATVIIKEKQKEGYGTPVTCTFTLTYNGKTVSASGLTNTEDCTLNSSSITIENTKIESLWLTVKKVDNNNMGIGSATFEVTFTQDKASTKNTLNIPESGGKYYETTAYSPKSFNPIYVTIKETKGPEHYNKANEDVKLKFVWEGTEKEGKWVPEITSGKKQLVAFTDAETTPSATYKYYPCDTERLIRTDKTKDRDFNRSFGIKIKNDPRIITDLLINKKDKSDKGIVAGATFRLYFNNVTYVKISGKKYIVKDIINENKVVERDGKKYYIKTADDLTLLVPTSETTSDYDNRLYIEGLKTNSSGQIKIEEIEAITNRDTVYIAVTELESVSGFDKLPDTAKLLLRYNNNGSNKWELFIRNEDAGLERFDELDKGNVNTLSSEYYSIDSGKLNLTLKDDFKLDSLTILKTVVGGSNPIAGAKFEIELTNVKSVNGKLYSNKIQTTTGTDGNIKLENLVIENINNPITVTITETKAPQGYKKINGSITITLKREGNEYEITEIQKYGDIRPEEYNSEETKVEGNELSIGIKDTPLINLGGIVWKDGQTEEKDVKEANGIKDSTETGLGEIKVTLYKEGSDTPITKDSYGNNLMTETAGKNGKTINYIKNNGEQATITLSEGEYIFPNLEGGTKYFVVFGYDGINYKTTNISSNVYNNNEESKVTEIGREDFNNKFKTIAKDEAIHQNESEKIKLEYEYSNTNETSKLKTTIKGENPANSNATDFQMTAKTRNYLQKTEDGLGTWKSDGTINTEHYALDINCGLIEKEFDLAIGTDVKEATLKINEKETTYNYAQIMDGALNADFQNSSSKVNVEYNLYLYCSDYNFRIDDYKTYENGGIKNNVNDKDDDEVNYDTLEELEVYVTYSIILKNQSKQEGTVNEFVYYYDSVFEPDNIVSTDTYDVSIDKDVRKITFTSKNGGFNLTDLNDYRATIDITFKVNKDSKGNIITKTATNVAEITEYSTSEGGLIDKDSAPENANVTFENGTPKVGQYEDDTDEAKGLNIVLNKEVRIITGTVFEDKDKNGKNDDNTLVNDVIVQLIEIKKIGEKNYEYIWQETRSGSNQVKTTTRNGYDQEAYENTVSNIDTGKYEFKDFIPGNYIIRFIYGDGTTYDLTETVKKYNGQDYKSTIDEHYKEEWYNSTKYTETSSVAVDNEARRLEVMAYSTKIDTTKATELKDKTKDMLDATWMCAETSKINVGVEDNKSNKNINFGLAQRPNTKLVLEKHITSLKITPQGTGVQPIVEARLNIDKILDGSVGSSDVEGIKTGLSIIKSTRDERGFWKVETDIEELAQGAKVELEYTYVIKNDGEEDYLSSDVIGKYKNSNGTDDYVEYLKGASETAKASVKGQRNNSGSYLGQYYYTGTKGTNDESVLSTVTKIEDNLNNNLKFVNTTNPSFTSKNGGEKVVYDANGNDNKETIETVLENIELFTTLGKGERDTTKTANLETTLSASSKEIAYPTYIGEITEYTNAAGRKDMESTPENLSYVHSEATNKTMNTDNEVDEFWGEKLIVSKPTGEDKQAPVQAIIIATTAIATIGIGIILIKKFVLKK